MSSLGRLQAELIDCRRCPRLVAWREEVARTKRRAYRTHDYWGRPVPGFGDPKASLVIVGLAPAAHGANRTGRMFTGDRSGDFLFAGLHRAGWANQPGSVSRDDGLRLRGVFICAPVRCAPPANKPTPDEVRACRPWLERELAILRPRGFLALGRLAWDQLLVHLAWPKPWPAFAHGALAHRPGTPWLLASYHVSQQNTQTGRLTAAMFDDVLRSAASLLDPPRTRG